MAWEHAGIRCRYEGDKPSCIGMHESTKIALVILGGAKSIWSDWNIARKLFTSNSEFQVMAINDIACQFKARDIHHIVTLHGKMAGALRTVRKEKSMLEDVTTHSDKNFGGVDRVWPDVHSNGGSSAMLAAKIALLYGYRAIILCGIQLDSSGHYFDPPDATDNDTTTFLPAHFKIWTELKDQNPYAAARIAACSGKLAEQFNYATPEWLHGRLHGKQSTDY